MLRKANGGVPVFGIFNSVRKSLKLFTFTSENDINPGYPIPRIGLNIIFKYLNIL